MLDLSHKIRQKSGSKVINFKIKSDCIDKDFVKKFGTKKLNEKSESELDQLNQTAEKILKNFKFEKSLIYDFRNLSSSKRGYLSLAKHIAVSIYQVKQNQKSLLTSSLSTSSSLNSILEESPTFPEDLVQVLESKSLVLPEKEELPLLKEETYAVEDFESESTILNLQENFSTVGIQADATMTQDGVNLHSYLKSLPKYDVDAFSLFEDYINKLEAYFGLDDRLDDQAKIKLLKYSVAQDSKLKMTLAAITGYDNSFSDFTAECIEIIDSKIKPCVGEVLSKIWSLRLSNHANLKEYFQSFQTLKASARNPEKIDEYSLVEAFLKSIILD